MLVNSQLNDQKKPKTALQWQKEAPHSKSSGDG